MLVQRVRSVLQLFKQFSGTRVKGQLKQMKRFVEDIQVNIKQVWKRKDDGLLVRVSGLIFHITRLGFCEDCQIRITRLLMGP